MPVPVSVSHHHHQRRAAAKQQHGGVRAVSHGKQEFVQFVMGRIMAKPSVVPVAGAPKPTAYMV